MLPRLISFCQGKGKQGCLVTLLGCISVLRGNFLKLFSFSFFSARLYSLMNHGSMNGISSGLMTIICFDWKPGHVMMLVKFYFT